MCGRYALWQGEDALIDLFGVDEVVDVGFRGSWNIAPSAVVPVIMERYEDDTASAPSKRGAIRRQLRGLEWGFVPHWARSFDRPLINARAETITEKPTFRSAVRKRRCLVPANGYFEWQAGATGKQPWFFSGGEGDPVLAFAGVYEAWRGGEGQPWRRTVAILTRSAPDALGEIHDRCPLVVPPSLWKQWWDPDQCDDAQVRRLIAAIPEPVLMPRPVSRAVGNVANNSPDLVEGLAR